MYLRCLTLELSPGFKLNGVKKMKLKISQVAKQAHVNIDTIRYYEKIGLLPHPERNSSGYRQYAADSIDRLKFIKRAQELGFSLHEIKELLSLKSSSDQMKCDEVRHKAEIKLKEIESKINTLSNMGAVMKDLISTCKARSASDECPILKSLEQEDGQ